MAGDFDLPVTEIEAKISFTQASLSMLEVGSKDYNREKIRLERKLRELETLLHDRQAEEQTRQYKEDLEFLDQSAAGTLPKSLAVSTTGQRQRPHSSYGSSTLPSGFSAYAGSHSGFGGHFASDGVLASQNGSGASPAWNFTSPLHPLDEAVDGTSSFLRAEPNPSSGSASSPDQDSPVPSPALPTMYNNPKKRQRDSLNLPNLSTGHAAKTMRATPSPAMTATTTPSSVGSDALDAADGEDFFRLMGGNPKDHMREFTEDQIAQERMIRERVEQERQDEEFARMLMQQDAAEASSGQQSQQWDHRQFLSSPSTTSTSAREQPLAYAWPVKKEQMSSRASDHAGISRRSQPRSNSSAHGMSDFIDLDDWDDTPGDNDSSDLVEVDSFSLHGSSRDKKPERKLPWANKVGLGSGYGGTGSWGATGQNALGVLPIDETNNYGALYPYGGNNVYNPTLMNGQGSTSWTQAAGQAGQTVANAAKGMYNAAYSLFDQAGVGFPGASSAYEYGYDLAGSSSNPQVIPDFDLDYYGQPQRMLQSALSGHSIDTNDPKNRDMIDRYVDRYNYLTNDPTRTSAEIKSLLENIRPDEDLPAENREGTPDAMTYPLMEHQKLGLAWMKSMEEGSNKGGILADDMGLGKTIQALALMVLRRSQDPTRKSTLIVAPVALMKQWEREIKQKLKPGREHRLTCFTLHGANRRTTWEQLKTYDVVLTTFGTLANEIKRKQVIDVAKKTNANWRPVSQADRLPLLGDECKWYRVIIDEAQCIKNKNTQAALGAASLQALTRFCMSGTPMMNNIGELFSLIHFLRIKPYNLKENFDRDFTKPLKQPSEFAKSKAMQKLQALLKAILLRRTKKSKIDGHPILTLPERTTESQHAAFNVDEQAVYRALESQTQLQFNKYLKAGTVGRNYSNVLVLLLRLRQACCHPHLINDFGMSSGGTDVSAKDMMALAQELAPDVIARIKDQSSSNEQSALECPICMDMAENATIFIPCGHSTCSECFARISDPSQAIAGGDADGRNVDIKCPNCRGKINPAKVIDHAAFKKIHMPEVDGSDELDPQADIETTDESDSDSDEDSDDDDSDDPAEIRDFVIADDLVDDKSDVEKSDDEPGEEGYRKGNTSFEKAAKVKSRKSKKGKGKGKATGERAPKKTLAQLKKEAGRNVKARRQYLRRLEKEWETSAKIEKVMEILSKIQSCGRNEKTIIFSQFTSLLDILEIPISRKKWGYKRYDGSMSSNARNEAVIEFSDNPRCKIMLVSLKAGNSGLNLVAASQVIILDPFWNPYIEEQAIDRAHRIGQMRPVQVHRILVPDTVEDRILSLQEKKRELIEGALDEKASQSIGRLGERELAFLFGVTV